jgi:hypothetical protein
LPKYICQSWIWNEIRSNVWYFIMKGIRINLPPSSLHDMYIIIRGHYEWLSHSSRRWWRSCAASFITWVRLASPIGSAAGGSLNLSTSLSNVAKLAAHPKFVCIFNANCDGTVIYNEPVLYFVFLSKARYFGISLSRLMSWLSKNCLAAFKVPWTQWGVVPSSWKYPPYSS